jgi:DNA-3-methyladenine glycosylase
MTAPARPVLSRAFLAHNALEVAPQLLNCLLVHGERIGRIVEVEAYLGSLDAASHAYRGQRPRNATMFGEPGHLYVYFTYGMHYCANVICSPEGEASAVLLRGLEPISGLDEMRVARGGVSDALLCSGPARLCQALGLDRAYDGADLLSGGELRLDSDGIAPPAEPLVGVRIGLSERSGESRYERWRFGVPGARSLSRPFPTVDGARG